MFSVLIVWGKSVELYGTKAEKMKPKIFNKQVRISAGEHTAKRLSKMGSVEF